ncbi:MBL fold metallo-hydrolase [Roseomonas indoligenes]|nr:MBL fold metallo-hydrolase [Pararoseomonas indoligenes]
MFFQQRRAPTRLVAEAVDPTRRRFLKLGCACCIMAAAPLSRLEAQAVGSAEVQRHLAAAREAAGTDLTPLLRLADVIVPPTERRPSMEELIRMPAPPPGRAFDNLVFLGSEWVTAWAVPTSDGIILIDAMDNDEQAETITDAGMRRTGLDPTAVKLLVVTHGHGDHYGGCGHFQRRYGIRVVMSGEDWRMVETKLEFDLPAWGRPPKRDIAVEDGGKVALGDTALDVIATPGHTMGTISLLMDLKDGGATHRGLLWGGTAFNFGRQPDRIRRLQAYIDGTARTREIAARQGVDVLLSNHTGWDGAAQKLAAKRPGAPNPFVLGKDTVQRALTVMHECARATMGVWNA